MKLDVKGTQFLEPLFEFSGACAGCGETPYIKLLTQLYGDRAIIANATGCSSIYGGNLPDHARTPRTRDGRGPAWANSLFEDNAEFGFGMRLAVDKHTEHARELLGQARRRRSATTWSRSCSRPTSPTEAGHRGAARPRRRCSRPSWPRTPALEARRLLAHRRLPGEEVGLDRRRRRLGLRHRLRRPRPRHRPGARREHPGARHRGLLQHRRPGLQGHAHGRGGQVRHGRQVDAEEGPGHAGHDLRPRLRGPGGHGGQGRADASTPSRRPTATPAPRSSSPTAHCIAHGYDMARRASSSRSWRSTPATGRSSATTRAAPPPARARSSSTARPPRSTSPSSWPRDPLPPGRGGQPGQLQEAGRRGAAARREKYALYEQLARP